MDFDFSLKMDGNGHVAVGGFEREKTSFFRLARQILQPKSGIFGEKFNEVGRKKGFFIAKGSHRNMSNNPAIPWNPGETERKKMKTGHFRSAFSNRIAGRFRLRRDAVRSSVYRIPYKPGAA